MDQELQETHDTQYMEVEEPQVQPINEKLIEEIKIYTQKINKFKKDLYDTIVYKDKTHNSNTLGPVYDYHGSLMHFIGFWISILDHYKLQMPAVNDPNVQQKAMEITQMTENFRKESVDSRTEAYNVLLKKSTEHPYIFINDN